MPPSPDHRRYWFANGVRLALRLQPQEGDDLIDHVLPGVRTLEIAGERVRVCDAAGRLVAVHPVTRVIGWRALRPE